MIPPETARDAPFSERRVYDALATLPDSWVVLRNAPIGLFGRPKPGLRRLDFLISHPHDRSLLQITVGAMPHDKVMRSIELVATEVAPAVRAEVGRRRAGPHGTRPPMTSRV